MKFAVDYHRLNDCRIDRSPADQGTLFQGDTVFQQDAPIQNFSDSGVCCVSKVAQTFSSHAGTHADQPPHFLSSPSVQEFDEDQYQGPALLLDVSGQGSALAITRDDIQRELDHLCGMNAIRNNRIILRTMAEDTCPSTCQTSFAHLSTQAAELFAEHGCPMVGIDTPSVDHPDEKCLSGAAHGILYRSRVAIVENVYLAQRRSSSGKILTLFDSVRCFEDARGISHMFFVEDE